VGLYLFAVGLKRKARTGGVRQTRLAYCRKHSEVNVPILEQTAAAAQSHTKQTHDDAQTFDHVPDHSLSARQLNQQRVYVPIG